MSELENIIKRRAEIAKKISKLQDLVEEDKELEVAQRVLERMNSPKIPNSPISKATNGISPGAETTIYNMLDLIGKMDVSELQTHVTNLTPDSYKSILSRMKKKGLIERDGAFVWVKPQKPSTPSTPSSEELEEEIPF